jgi:hypothetical protein
MAAAGQQPLLDQVGDHRFSGARRPSQPQHRRPRRFECRALIAAVDFYSAASFAPKPMR